LIRRRSDGKRARQREEAARVNERERRQRAVDKAQAALEEAEREHDKRATALDAERTAVENNPKPRMCVGRRKRKNWKVLCAGRETRARRAAATGDGHG
jgi:hypothetical protein